MIWKWLVIKNTRYDLTTQRLKTRFGVLNKHIDELELYRIQDYKIEQPLFLRIFSLSNIILETSDSSHPHFVLRAVPNGEQILDKIRFHVEECKAKKRLTMVDIQ
jgi:uncharacterized membrane protein YdbT with pleckstrin-like domain